MGSCNHQAARRRFQLSALVLLLLGFFSIASPDAQIKIAAHHRAPVHSSRTSRDIGRSRTSSSRTSAEAEIEPEIPFALPQVELLSKLHLGTPVTTAALPNRVLPSVALFPQPPPTLHAPSMVCISCTPQDDPSVSSTASYRPDRGRAPPLA